MKLTRLHTILVAFAIIALGVGMLSYISATLAAFGTSPPSAKNDHMLPGSTFEQVINLSRNETESSMQVVPLIRGDEQLVKWITIPEQKDLVMRAGQTSLPMKVTINVPEHAALKNYRGSIYVTLSPLVANNSLKGGEVGITLGANINVDITVVGNKVTDYWIKSILNDPIQEGNPFSLKVEVENLGNTEISNIDGQIEIYSNPQNELLETFPLIPLEKPLLPDDTRISRMIFEDIMLDAGDYWVVAKAFKNGEVAYENRMSQKMIPKADSSKNAIGEKPALPGTVEEGAVEEAKVTPLPVVEAPFVDTRPAAPEVNGVSNAFLIFGLAGLGFGLIALIGVIIVLIYILKNQQKPLIANYPVQPKSPQPVQPQSEASNPNESANINMHAENQK